MRWEAYDAEGRLKTLQGSVMPVVPNVRAHLNAAQSIGNGSWTALSAMVEDIDTDGMHSDSTNPSRFTVRTAGKYLITGVTSWAGNATGGRGLEFRLNGGSAPCGSSGIPGAADGFGPSNVVVLDLAPGDYLEAFVYQSSGGALNCSTAHVAMFYVGPGIMAAGGIGERELAYGERTSNLTVTATTAATAQDVVVLPPLTFDGRTTIIIEAFAYIFTPGNLAAAQLVQNLWDDTTDIGRIGLQGLSITGTPQWHGTMMKRITPTAGTHIYKWKAWRTNADGTIECGTGVGVDSAPPAFLRVKRVN